MSDTKRTITQLLASHRAGDAQAMNELLPIVYTELKKIARAYAGRNRVTASLQPTALVNEMFLKLLEGNQLVFNDRTHFFATAAQCMRWLLADAARAKSRQKREGGKLRVTFQDHLHGAESDPGFDAVAVNEALTELEAKDKELARVVEMRYLAGLSVEEVAEALKLSPATVKRRWTLARAWLQERLSRKEAA